MLKNGTDFIAGFISIYMILIIIRIVMSWFSTSSQKYSEKGTLAKLCDPYLNIFKKIPFFTIGYIDFSPIIALAVLVIIGNILTQFGLLGTITVGIILAITIKAIWSALSSIIFFLFIIVIIRLIVLLIKPNAQSPILKSVDSLLLPVSGKVSSFFTRNSNYPMNLLLFAVLMAIFYFLGNFLIDFLADFVSKFPF
ncbi:MAG: YggT family protein [Spirochaetaceae bacterium]|nr:YggT family protein [Spirochaetaceae bacterium]